MDEFSKKDNKQILSIRIPKDILDKLKKIAAMKKTTLTKVVEVLLSSELKNWGGL